MIGTYYFNVCHTCHVYTKMNKYTLEYAEFMYHEWMLKYGHQGHEAYMTNDYDDLTRTRLKGWEKTWYESGWMNDEVFKAGKINPYRLQTDEKLKADGFFEAIGKYFCCRLPQV